MDRRTTLTADQDDLETLRAQARRRGVSLARLLREVIAEKAEQVRASQKPRLGIGCSDEGVGRASVEDEDSPASTPPRS